MSMAAGEYVSVSSQADAEKADLDRERKELVENPAGELGELTDIYLARGLSEPLARQVAEQLMAGDALAAHARDELGISETIATRPIQAAIVSALTFSAGAIVPIVVAIVSPTTATGWAIFATTILGLAILGGLGASAGGAGIAKGAMRVTFWGALAMAATAAIGIVFGVAA
jgi:VIT1/CCC1 family predicted Fe2+/Mn2+ transporter